MGLHLLFFSSQASLSEAANPSVVPSIGVVVILGLVPCTLKDRLGDQRGGSEWEPIKILLDGDQNSNKMN
jgi:hypothetical protein